MKKSIYSITAYIPSDENKVVSDIKKICPISQEGHCVVVSIKEDHGVGTGLKYPEAIYPSTLDALLNLGNIEREEFQKIGEMEFTEALLVEQQFIVKLTSKLT